MDAADGSAAASWRVIDILRRQAPGYARRYRGSRRREIYILGKLTYCRTGALGGSWHWCAKCGSGVRIPNSCGDRHCPLCRGAQRATWVDRMQSMLLPAVSYYQVVFTIPSRLSVLALANRRAMYNLLFRAAWESLRVTLEAEQGYEAAAAMILHTWNQKLQPHAHVHAVVPGGGPSLRTSGGWKTAEPPPHLRSDRWWLVDADNLRHKFRERYLSGLRRLYERGELRFASSNAAVSDDEAFAELLCACESTAWVTYIEPPPQEADPGTLVRYLARYLTGGPISDSRVSAVADESVTFLARSGQRRGGTTEKVPVTVPAAEFIDRWCLHILPKGYTKSRRFGGWSNHHSERYTRQCRELIADGHNSAADSLPSPSGDAEALKATASCPSCGGALERLERVHRTSWRDVFGSSACPRWFRYAENFY